MEKGKKEDARASKRRIRRPSGDWSDESGARSATLRAGHDGDVTRGRVPELHDPP